MPTPFVHSAVGLAAALMAPQPQGTRARFLTAGAFLFAANAADLDFLPGVFGTRLIQFHHLASHSLCVAVLIAGLASLVARRHFWLLLAVAFSHPLLDLCTYDALGFYKVHGGIWLLWPFSRREFSPIAHVFFAPYVGPDMGLLFSAGNLMILIVEGVLTSALVAAIWTHRRGWRFGLAVTAGE